MGAKKQPPVGDVKEAVARTASNAAKDPLDVTQWLAADASSDTTSSETMDTRDSTFTDTDSIGLSATQTVTPESAVEQEAPKRRKGKKKPGKLPPIPNTTKDSQDAAANVLARMRKRR